MRVLTTVLTPSDGEVYLDGIRYGTGKDEVIRQKIGYLPQELNLYPGLSVQDCLEYLGELSGIPKEECKKRIRYYLEKTGLTNHRKKKMRQLSGGMKRRVGLIQALLNEPEFLIVDEPTTGLDPEERVRIRNLLVDFSEGRTVLFSTHVVEDIAATCSRLAVNQHKYCFVGYPSVEFRPMANVDYIPLERQILTNQMLMVKRKRRNKTFTDAFIRSFDDYFNLKKMW